MLECNDCYFINIEEYATCRQCKNRNLWVSEGTYKLLKELEVKMMNKIDELKRAIGNLSYGGGDCK